jgi:hypothetical protein
MVMNKIVLTVLSLMFGSLMTVVVSQPTIEPVAASNANGCAAKQNDSASARQGIEMDGIRFEAFTTRNGTEEKFSPGQTGSVSQEIRFPESARTGYWGVRLRATNCTNEAVGLGKFKFASMSLKLLTSDGKEVQTSRLEERHSASKESSLPPRTVISAPDHFEAAIGLEVVRPGNFFQLGSTINVVREGDSLTMRVSSGTSSSDQVFYQLQPGKIYQIQLTYSIASPSETNFKRITQQPKIWAGKVTLPAVPFRLVESNS